MKIRFWGTHGSIPGSTTAADVRRKVFSALKSAQGVRLPTDMAIHKFIDDNLPFAVSGSYGNNTTCFEIDNPGGPFIIIDCGSGLRDLGWHLVTSGMASKPNTYHIFMTHLHWDHIQGFPFFAPAFIPGNTIVIHSYHETTESAFVKQMEPPCFPVPISVCGADIQFDIQTPATPYALCGFQITAIEQNHPGVSYGYRFERGGKSIVISTDSEHKKDACSADYPFVEFFRDADLVVFDAQYSMADAFLTKSDWGHSSNVMGVELATRAKAKRLALCHHEHTSSDERLEDFLKSTRLYREIYSQETDDSAMPGHPLEVMLAYDGLEIRL